MHARPQSIRCHMSQIETLPWIFLAEESLAMHGLGKPPHQQRVMLSRLSLEDEVAAS